jgi:hypothetical protein
VEFARQSLQALRTLTWRKCRNLFSGRRVETYGIDKIKSANSEDRLRPESALSQAGVAIETIF